MMTSQTKDHALPKSSCSYERYDPETLQPLNEETRVRLVELGWTVDDFTNKTVLDIGANTGMLSIEACRLGARKINAYDVQVPLVEFLRNLAKTKKLPIQVARRNLGELKAPDDAADVVLFMEVLHWVVSQGTPLASVIEKLASLTRQTLFIEFPWSIAEPSIKNQTKLTERTYSSDQIIDLLTQYFADVRIVRFMRYMGAASGSQRVLIKASAPRWTAHVLSALPDVRTLDISVGGNRHRNALAHGPNGLLFVKELAPESVFNKLPAEVVNRLFDRLIATKAKCLALPIRLSTDYVNKRNGTVAMVFPYLGEGWGHQRNSLAEVSLDSLIQFLAALRAEMAAVETDIIPQFPASLSRTVSLPSASNPDWQSMFAGAAISESDFRILNSDIDQQQMKSLQHGDLQVSNLLKIKGRLVAVDLDNISIGTPYSDGLCALIWYGASSSAFEKLVGYFREKGEPAITSLDIALAARIAFGWFSTVSALMPPEARVIVQFMSGYHGFLEFAARLPFSERLRARSIN